MCVQMCVRRPRNVCDAPLAPTPCTPRAQFERISRRAPGSSDVRAARAALYWRAGQYEAAESAWQFACESITAGCRKYADREWLQTVRRWPPVMVAYLQDFLQLRSGVSAVAGNSSSSLRQLQLPSLQGQQGAAVTKAAQG